MKIVIVGGGAAGLMAAINIKNEDNEVVILEKNEEVGKKILVTGNGRCNLWNFDMHYSKYNSSNPELLDKIITPEYEDAALNKLVELFSILKNKNNYLYPRSNKATTVRDVLLHVCNKLGVEIITNYTVTSIKKTDKFIINNDITCDKLIISCGGKSLPITGSDGSIYSILKDMGHTIIEPLPSLVPLFANESYLNKWNGIRCDAKVTSIIDGKKIKEESGELQLTDYGISGICVFNISRDIVKALNEGKNATVQISFLELGEDEKAYFELEEKNNTVYELLLKVFDKKLIKILLEKMDINPDAYIKSLTTKEMSRLANYIERFNINITGHGDFNKSQVTQGGVSLEDINPDTLESKKIKDLYLIGEVLDIDGDCGGYNLGFAWMSALKVSDHIC